MNISRKREADAARKKAAEERREANAKQRAAIVVEILDIERRYGISEVASAYSRHTMVRRERRKLEAQQRETAAKIAKLSR